MKIFDEYNNIVIKIGSSIIVDQVKTSINTKWLYSLCSDVKFLSNKGKHCVFPLFYMDFDKAS